jgi:hypothetical protein
MSRVPFLTKEGLDVESGPLTVGVAGTGQDVYFYGDTSGKHLLWDQSEMELALTNATKLKFWDIGGGEEIVASADGHLEINAGTTLDITAPTVAINGSTSLYGGLGVGQDGTGHNVYFYGDTLGSWVKWNWSTDSLRFTDSTPIEIGDNQDMTLYHDGTNSYITNITGTLNILANHGASNSKNVNIGGSISEVTIGDNLTVTDTLTELSMREMKTNIEPIENILPAVLQMQGVSFDWKKDEDGGLTNYGFIAEDVDKILPNLVSHDEEGKAQGIQYSKMTAVLLEAIKEQQVQIDELKSKIN